MSSAEGSGLTLRKINVKQKDLPSSATTTKDETPAVEEPVTPAGRLFMEPNMNCHIMCALAFANPIDVPLFKQTLSDTLVNHKRFHSIIKRTSKGKDVWVPVEVNIDQHIVEPTVDTKAPRFLESYIEDLSVSTPLDVTRPMWECHILNGEPSESKPAAYMVVRLHHALGDGTSLMSLLLACTRRLGHPEELPAVPVARRKERPARSSFLTRVFSFFILMWNTLVGITHFLSTAIWLRDSETVLKGHSGVENEKKKLVIETVDMAELAIVKNAVNGTINDVLMAVIGEGLLHYLEGRYATSPPTKSTGEIETTTNEIEVDAVKSKKSKVENLRVRACALMNTRQSPGLQELASMMDGGSQHRWGNHMGYLIMRIPLTYHTDPLDYVRAAKKINDQKKASLEGIYSYISGAMLMNLTGPHAACILTRRVTLQTTLAISNVPGPTEAVMFGENPIVGIYPTAIGHPQSISFYLQTYNGKASFVILSAVSYMPDPEVLSKLCMDSLRRMVKAAEALKGFGQGAK